MWLRWLMAVMLNLATCQFTIERGLEVVNMLRRAYDKSGFPYKEESFLGNMPINDSYDFIVVGAGPGGCVVANRLSENMNWTVLLLEAGTEGNIYTDIPAMHSVFAFTNFNWKYVTEPQPELMCRGMANGRCKWPSGKGVGGTSIWNGLMWTRCPAHDFDEWEALGNPGWAYKDMLKSWMKIENMTIPDLRDSPYHGTTGPVGVSYPWSTKLGDVFLKSGQELGYDVVDYNNPDTPLGFSRTQTNTNGGRRVDAAKAYLMPVRDRPNLHVLKAAFVNRIIIDDTSKTATGVEFVKNKRKRTVQATKDVIISAGAFNTPKILMLSGIGPAEHLESKNIQVIQDSPAVGQNLQEHIAPLSVIQIDEPISFTVKKLAPLMIPAFREWMTTGRGLLTHNIAEAVGYVKTDASLSKPDVEMIFSPMSIAGDDGTILRKYFGIADDTYNYTWAPINQREAFTVCPMGMYPKSKGEVRLKSAKPKDPPLIITNFLKEPEDVKNAIDAQRLIEKLVETPAMKAIGARLYKNPIYRCDQYEFGTNDYYECSARTVTIQFHHQCCSAKMGPDPSDSAVSPRLKVHGINGLRVVDASVMPKIPGAHTMAVTYAIAENAADIIKEDWSNEL